MKFDVYIVKSTVCRTAGYAFHWTIVCSLIFRLPITVYPASDDAVDICHQVSPCTTQVRYTSGCIFTNSLTGRLQFSVLFEKSKKKRKDVVEYKHLKFEYDYLPIMSAKFLSCSAFQLYFRRFYVFFGSWYKILLGLIKTRWIQ